MSREATKGDSCRKARGEAFLAAFDWLLRNLALWFGGTAIFAMVLLTFLHVFRRYVLNDPITGFVDLGQVLLAGTIAFSIAYSGRTGGQIALELIDGLIGACLSRLLDIAVRLTGAAMVLTAVAILVGDAPYAEENGEATTTLGISYEPLFYLLAFGLALYAMVLIVEAIRQAFGKYIGQERDRLFGGDDAGSV